MSFHIDCKPDDPASDQPDRDRPDPKATAAPAASEERIETFQTKSDQTVLEEQPYHLGSSAGASNHNLEAMMITYIAHS